MLRRSKGFTKLYYSAVLSSRLISVGGSELCGGVQRNLEHAGSALVNDLLVGLVGSGGVALVALKDVVVDVEHSTSADTTDAADDHEGRDLWCE